MTLSELLKQSANAHPKRTALIFNDSMWNQKWNLRN